VNCTCVDVLWGPRSCWCFMGCAMLRQENRPQRGMSPGPGCQSHCRGRQGCSIRAVISLSVLSLPWSCSSSLHPVMTLAGLSRGAGGWLLLDGLRRSRVGVQVLLAPEEEGQSHGSAHTAGPNLPPPGPAGTHPRAGSLMWTCSFLRHHQWLCCDCNILLSPAVICFRDTSLGCWSSLRTSSRPGVGKTRTPAATTSQELLATPPAQPPSPRAGGNSLQSLLWLPQYFSQLLAPPLLLSPLLFCLAHPKVQ